jgi:hypothetical protein
MPISAYRFVEPDEHGPVWAAFHPLASRRPVRAARLLAAIDDFVLIDTEASCLAAQQEDGGIQLFLVPPRHALAVVADAAALILVDHGSQTFSIAELIEDYGGVGEPDQWARVRTSAAAHLWELREE